MLKTFFLRQSFPDQLLVILALDDDVGAIVNPLVFEDEISTTYIAFTPILLPQVLVVEVRLRVQAQIGEMVLR